MGTGEPWTPGGTSGPGSWSQPPAGLLWAQRWEPGLQSQTEQVCTSLCPSCILDPVSVSLAAPREQGLLTGFLSTQGVRGMCADPLSLPFCVHLRTGSLPPRATPPTTVTESARSLSTRT